jgi:4Fe-4S ferredoxin
VQDYEKANRSFSCHFPSHLQREALDKADRITPFGIYKVLPKTNCKRCGKLTCMAFAVSLIAREKQANDCPELETEKFIASLKLLKSYFPKGQQVEKTGLIIHKEKCNGCGDCAVVCNRALKTVGMGGSIRKREDMPPVLKIVNGIARVINWESCKRSMQPPELCSICESKCALKALEMVPMIDGEED